MSDRKGTGWVILALALMAGAALAIYHNSFGAPFVFDDALIVGNNPTIRQWATALAPPHNGSTVEGRPLVNLSLALNYAISGRRVGSYHLLNLAIHLLAGFTLFGIVRRSIQGPAGRATALAFAVALLWLVHPLQTEAVTYVAQRAEALAGLLYLLTLYCFIRGARGETSWLVASGLACLAGTATKEIIVTAPVLVLLYDRTFLSGSFRAAWRQRKTFYVALAATWIPLGALVLGAANRSGTAGFGTLRWSDYALTQVYAVPHYLRLSLWPAPLVFDYGKAVIRSGGALFFGAIVLLLLIVATAAGLASRTAARRKAGFLGAWFFAILAPTSLIPVATQTMAEHRMYLPLAAVVTALVLVLERILRRPVVIVALAGLTAAGLGATTIIRNRAYQSEVALWSDTVAKQAANDRAHNNLGNALFLAGRIPEAVGQYEEALRLHPQGNADVEYNLGNGYLQMGKLPEAISHGLEAVRLAPANPEAHNNLGMALERTGRSAEAAVQFQEAIVQYHEVLQSDPEELRMRNGLAIAHFNAGNLLAQAGKMAGAITNYEQALQFKPDLPEAQLNLGNALLADGQTGPAISHYQAALKLRPDYPQARYILDRVLRPSPPPVTLR